MFMFKTTGVEKKRNKSTYRYTNKFRAELKIIIFCSLQRLSWDSLGIKNVTSTHTQNF